MHRGYLVDAFRSVFKLPKFNPMNQQGVMEETVWQVMDDFFAFQAKKKENTDLSPTSPPSSEFPGQSPTTSSTDSGLTSHAA